MISCVREKLERWEGEKRARAGGREGGRKRASEGERERDQRERGERERAELVQA